MALITAYHRPSTLGDALTLLAADGAIVLGGGTALVAREHDGPAEVVDLQDLGLDAIEVDGNKVRIGAMARLQDVVDDDAVPALLRELAHREDVNTIRNAATVGGTVAAGDPESELLVGLLAYDAVVTVAREAGSDDVAIDEVLSDTGVLMGGIITSVTVPAGRPAVADRVGRTPADKPIVAAAATIDGSGTVRLALTGVASTPVLADPTDLAALDPPADFRGSADYRRELAAVLGARLTARLAE